MKYISAVIGIMFWIVFTSFLALTVYGLILMAQIGAYWKIPRKLLKVFKK